MDLPLSGDPTIAARVRAVPGIDRMPAGLEIRCVMRADRTLLDELDDADGVRVVIVVGEVPTPHLIRALWRRCDGVVRADDLDATLLPTLRAVAAGQCVYPASFREDLRRPALSAREKQILAMVVLGMANIEIATKLYVAESSVKAHLTSAFGKLGVRSRDEAAAVILDPDAGYGPGILRITEDEAAQA